MDGASEEYPIICWFNWHLNRKGVDNIQNLTQLKDGALVLDVLGELLEKTLPKSRDSHNWVTIFDCLGLDSKSLLIPDQETDAKWRSSFVKLLLHVILNCQLYEHTRISKMYKNYHTENEYDLQNESDELLKWVNRKNRKYRITNWNSDWVDGKVLCHLINAIRPMCIPDSVIFQDVREIRIRAACTRAENELGVPDLILPEELLRGECKEEVLLTYVAFLRDVDRTHKNPDMLDRESEEKDPTYLIGIPFTPSQCLAFGSGLRWGQVGKPAEFIMQLQKNVSLSDILVSIECRPYDHKAPRFRPQLEIKPLDSKCYLVKYTPTRPGRYFIGILCGNRHIANSPYQISIKETVITNEFLNHQLTVGKELEDLLNPTNDDENGVENFDLNNNIDKILSEIERDEKNFLSPRQELQTKCGEYSTSYDSAFIDDDELHSPSLSSGEFPSSTWLEEEETLDSQQEPKHIKVSNFKIFGTGLHSGEVGRISTFMVHTPTYIDQTGLAQGPLCVSITCPAVSIPVPFVRTKFVSTMLEHQVIYIPTEPGIYEITVKWGDGVICGSPFRLSVSDSTPTFPSLKLPEKTKLPVFRNAEKFDLFLYYSATTEDASQHQRKDVLEQLLQQNSPNLTVFSVPLDIELNATQRRALFEQAEGKHVPFVFVHNQFLGDYRELMAIHHKIGLQQFLENVVSELNNADTKWRDEDIL